MTDLPLIRAKISLPRRPQHLLSRPRLHHLLDETLEHHLTLIRAPAGYGKTSALVDWAHQISTPVCWYTLDETDRDPQQFLTHYVGAIAQRFPGFGGTTLGVLRGSESAPDPGRLARVVAHDIEIHVPVPFLLIVDDYHLVGHDASIRRFVSDFLKYTDESCHIILTLREHVRLKDIALLTARSQTIGLNQEDLAFTAADIQALLLQNYRVTVSDALAAELAEETEGWITGLLLASPAMAMGITDRIRAAQAAGIGLHDYLAQQILDRQPPVIRDFLLRSSLLETFDAELCAAVLGDDEDWVAMMETIQHRNLFVASVDDSGRWLRYHHLFQDFLRATIQRESPDVRDEVLRRLADVYITDQLWAQAYAIYHRLDDQGATVALIEKAGSWMVKHGQLSLLSACLQALPQQALRTGPALLSLQGVVRSASGEVAAGLSLQSEALDMLSGQQFLELAVRIRLRRAADHRLLGEYQAALRDVEAVLALTEHRSCFPSMAAEALRLKGMILLAAGHATAATWWLDRSLEAFMALDEVAMIALSQMELGVALFSISRYREAQRYYEQSLRRWQQIGNMLRQSTVLNNLGTLNALKGEYKQAGVVLDKALACARQTDYAYSEALSLASLGDLYVDLRALGTAHNAYTQALKIAERTHDRFLQVYLHIAQAALARIRGELARARHHMKQAGKVLGKSASAQAQGIWHLGSGRQALAEGAVSEAQVELETAIQHFETGGQRAESDFARLHLAATYASIGRKAQAAKQIEMALDRGDKTDRSHLWLTVGQEVIKQLRSLAQDPVVGFEVTRLLVDIDQWHHEIPEIRRYLRQHSRAFPFAPPRITVQALGSADIFVDGKPVSAKEWGRVTSRDLLYCLLAHPKGQSKEAIGLILWPDSSPTQLKQLFKKAIQHLRLVLGPDAVVYEEGRYRFNTAQEYLYDVQTFEARLAEAHALIEPPEAVSALLQALAIYQGPYLPNVERVWVEPERERLHRLYTQAELTVATYHLEHGAPDEVLACCERLLADDPAMEPAHRLAMQALCCPR